MATNYKRDRNHISTMSIYYYLSLIPESLIASMLPPDEFGNYYAIGTQKRSRGQAIFFELDPDALGDLIDKDYVRERCIPHEDGSPRKSTYLKIYRVLESVPVKAIKRLYLVTDEGRVLGLDPGTYEPEPGRKVHLYQELCPVTPRVVSKLNPVDFCKSITKVNQPISVPRIVFAEMRLEALAHDPDARKVDNLPYPNIDHLRDCIREVQNTYAKPNKTVIRQMKNDFLYRTIRGGFYLGDANDFVYFPMPTQKALEEEHYSWWRSALSSFGS